MPCSAPDPSLTRFAVGLEVARLGEHRLYEINKDYYQLTGPDSNCSRAWLTAHLPAGDWLTEWTGDDELVVHITR